MTRAHMKSQLQCSQEASNSVYRENTFKSPQLGFGRHLDLAPILNWLGSEHLHHRFGCQERQPQLGTELGSS